VGLGLRAKSIAASAVRSRYSNTLFIVFAGL
jgi:hypothetical protein